MRDFFARLTAFFSKNEADKTINPLLRFFFYVCFFMVTVALIVHVAIFFIEKTDEVRREPASSPYRQVD